MPLNYENLSLLFIQKKIQRFQNTLQINLQNMKGSDNYATCCIKDKNFLITTVFRAMWIIDAMRKKN